MRLTLKMTIVLVALLAAATLAIGAVSVYLEWQAFQREHRVLADQIAERAKADVVDAPSIPDRGPDMESWSRELAAQVIQLQWVWLSPEDSAATLPELADNPNLVVGTQMTFIRRESEGGRQLHTIIPLVDQGDRVGALDISESMNLFDRRVRNIIWTSIGSLVVLFLIAVLFIAWVGTRMVGRPLSRLVEGTRQIADGNFDMQLDATGSDELATLANALNEMAAKLKSQRLQLETETEARINALNQLRHADRLQTIGQLASGIAHELGTPLNVIQGHADLILSDQLSEQDRRESAETIKREVQRMTQIVRQVLDLSRKKTGFRSPVDLVKLVRETAELLRTVAHRHNVDLLVESDLDRAIARCDPEQMKQVLINLIMNAIQAMPSGGTVRLTVDAVPVGQFPPTATARRIVGRDAPGFVIRIRDNGPGIPPEHRDKVFEPFFTTKSAEKGTGLGLSIAYGIVQEHGGSIDFESEQGKGTEFRIWLPVECQTDSTDRLNPSDDDSPRDVVGGSGQS